MGIFGVTARLQCQRTGKGRPREGVWICVGSEGFGGTAVVQVEDLYLEASFFAGFGRGLGVLLGMFSKNPALGLYRPGFTGHAG